MQNEENNTIQKFGDYLKESLMPSEDQKEQIRQYRDALEDLPNLIERQHKRHEKFTEDLLRETEK